jgi:hypothetical protein
MRVTGPKAAVATFRTQHIRPHKGTDGLTLDFNTVIPAPEILTGIEASSRVEMAMEKLSGREFIKRAQWSDEQRARFAAAMEELTPAELRMGEQALQALAETGHATWYSWNIAHWGTKWNAYDFSVVEEKPSTVEKNAVEFVCRFDTAWSTPHPVFVQLAAMHPDLVFWTDSYDEGGNFATHGEGTDGVFDEYDRDTNAEAYEAAYGHTRDEEVDA